MNSHDDKIFSEQYQQVPRVDSPEHLDKQILEAAHRHVPVKHGIAINRWVPALATACVAGVVFYIATPLIDSPSDLRPPAVVSETATMSDAEEVSDGDSREVDVVDDLRAGFAAGTAQQKQFPAQSRIEKPSTTAARIQKSMKKAEQSDFMFQEEVKSEAEPRRSTSIAKKQNQSLGVVSQSASSAGSQPSEKTAASASIGVLRSKNKIQLSPEEITLRIEKINALAEKALDDDATRLLKQLIVQCPECALPEILAELNETLIDQEQIESKQND